MTKGSGDFFPPPPTFDQEAAFLDPRPAGSFRGRQAYLFRTLGGPGPLGGQAGLMAMGDRSIRGWLASGYGPLSLFVLDEALENGDQPVAGDAVFHFRPEAPGLGANRVPSPFLAPWAEKGARKKNGPRKKGQPPVTSIPGGDLFLDPSRGWLMALAEGLPGSREAWPAGLWPPHDPAAPLAPGVTFIWALGDQLPGLVAGLAANLMADGQVLVISGLDVVLEKVAMDLGPDLVSLDPRPTASGHLDQAALETLMDRARADRAKEAEEARAGQAIHRRTEDLVSERLDHWTRREGLERSLSHLRDEAFQRQGEWATSEANLAAAQAGFEALARRQGGLLGLLGRRGGQGRAQAAKARLEEAEKAMRRARMEMESLLAEARTVEADLAEARDSSRDLPPKEEILAELSALRATGQDLASRAAGLERPIPEAQAEASVLASKKVVLARLGSWLPPGGFETLIVAAPVVTDRKSREALASLALLAKRRLVVAADFHGWSWTAPAPAGQDGQPAWRNLMAAPALEGPLPGTLSFLGPLPPIQAPGQGAPPRECLLPDPSRHAFLGRMGFSSGLARLPLNHPTGPALRAFGDGGPICPASALASVRLAVEAARSAAASGEPGDIYILSPGRAQAALARSLLSDFGSPAGVMAGEPHDFELWPPAPMAILDTALAPPLAGSDLSSPETGRPAILRALSLASGALVVCADPASVEALSPDSVLRGLWARLQDSAWPGWLPPQPAPFWEALDKARDEALFVMPPFGPSWWPPLAGHFLSALRRKVRLTIISELPPEESRQFPGQVIRELRLNGANVILSEGFRDLMALIDGHHFSLGAPGGPGGPAGHKRWPFLVSLELPRTAPLISGLLQSRTLQDKLGPGGPHNCPLCGWPFVLVNQGRPRDFDYRQSLRLGCLNTSCANHRRPRRLDERWPFPAPPVCPRDNLSAYVLSPPGRGQSWVCPRHGPECPSYRLVPGDCPNHRP